MVWLPSVRRHHAAVQERDRDDVLLALHGEDAGLVLQRDHLQDLRQLEYGETALERHGSLPALGGV